MNCSSAKTLLSAYYDGELALDQRALVNSHLADCPSCAEELRSFEWLSGLTQRLPEPEGISGPWVASAAKPKTLPGRRIPWVGAEAWPSWVAMAAAVLLIAGAWWGVGMRDHSLFHGRPTDLAAFLTAMDSDPQSAQQSLLSRFDARLVSLDVASQALGYRPAAAEGLPSGWEVSETYLLDMPCCTCAQVICTKSEGRSVSVFEHEAERAIVFKGEPERKCVCHGEPTTVAGSEGALAATWKRDKRYVTLVGAKDLDEVEAFVGSLMKKDASGGGTAQHDQSM